MCSRRMAMNDGEGRVVYTCVFSTLPCDVAIVLRSHWCCHHSRLGQDLLDLWIWRQAHGMASGACQVRVAERGDCLGPRMHQQSRAKTRPVGTTVVA